MRLIADGGSTKIDWLLTDDEGKRLMHTSVGLNPTMLSADEIVDGLRRVAEEWSPIVDAKTIEFYGAGCTPVASEKMAEALRTVIAGAETVTVDSDIIGAAKALLGDEEGIACILGTGACSCHWGRKADGSVGIVSQTPALGYILGDEGSGAVLGRLMINAMYKGVLPRSICDEFERAYDVDMYGVIEHVYRMPQPNRWLASLSPFVHSHMDNEQVAKLVCENLRAFFVRNILPYGRMDLPVSFVGSIAYYYEEQLRIEAEKLGVKIGMIRKSPL